MSWLPWRWRPRRWRWRRLRLALPFAVVFGLFLVTGLAHAAQRADVTDPDYLNPTSSTPHGAAQLAEALTAEGVTIQRVSRSTEALIAADRPGSGTTLFVPAPGLVNPAYLEMMVDLLPGGTRVVLVAPSGLSLSRARLPVRGTRSRWATAAVLPGCGLPAAVAAGRAAVRHTYYGPAEDEFARCYQGGLVGLRYGSIEVILVGASDPFRNDRIREYGNAGLASGLLSARPNLVWLDLHRTEPPPAGRPPVVTEQSNGLATPEDPGQPPGNGHGIGGGNGGQGGNGSGDDQARGANALPNPLWSAFPPWTWAALVLLGLVALALALSAARRIGPPVPEPLPVAVRGVETIEGRGRLYRRAKARGTALDALRGTARRRLLDRLDLPPDTDLSALSEAVAAHTERPVKEVWRILAGPAPSKDAALLRAVAELDALLDDVLGPGPGTAGSGAAGPSTAGPGTTPHLDPGISGPGTTPHPGPGATHNHEDREESQDEPRDRG